MPAETYVRQGGTWRKVGQDGPLVRQSNSWHPALFIYARHNGAWRTVYVRDVTGPVAPTNVTATWSGTSGGRPRCLVNWTNPPDADYDRMRVRWRHGTNLAWNQAWVNAPTSQFFAITNNVWNATLDIHLTPFDEFGNAGDVVTTRSMLWTGQARGARQSPFVINALDSGSFILTGGPWISGKRVRQGVWGGTEYMGAYFYGDQIWTWLRGATISNASIQLFRSNAGETGGVFPYMWRSHISSKAQSPWGFVEQGPAAGTSPQALDGSHPHWAWQPIPSNWYNNMTNPTQQRLRTIVFYSQGTPLTRAEYFGQGETPGTVVPGRLTIEHSG